LSESSPISTAPQGDTRSIRSAIAAVILASVTAVAWWQSGAGLIGKGPEGPPLATYSPYASRIRPLSILDEEGAEAAIPKLIEALNADETRIRREAVLALFRAGEAARPAVSVLRRTLSDPDSQVRGQSATALGRIDRGSRETAAAIVRLLQDRDSQVVNAAGVALSDMGPVAMPAVLPLLTDSNPEMRLHAVQILQRLHGYSPEAVAALRRATNDSNSTVREGAIVALLLDQRADLSEVIRWLHDGNKSVCDAAVTSLPTFGPAAAAALPDLIQRLEAPLPSQLPWLLFALRSLRQEAAPAVPALLTLIDSPVEYDLADILETLVEIGAKPEAVSQLLVRFLNDDSSRIASRSGNLLSRVDPETARRQAAILAERLTSRRGETVALAMAGLRGLGVNAADAVPQLDAMLRQGDTDTQAQVANVLSRIGPRAVSAFPTIVALLRDATPTATSTPALIEAAGAIGPEAAPAIPRILELFRSADDSSRRNSRSLMIERVRCAALVAAANIGVRETEYLALAEAGLSSPSSTMRIAALQAFSIIGESASRLLPDLLSTLDDRETAVRLAAAQSIVNCAGGDPRVVRKLIPLLEDEDYEVRAAAAVSLGRIGAAAVEAVPALRTVRGIRENYLPLSSLRQMRTRSLSNSLVQSQFPYFSVGQAVDEALRRIAPEQGAAAR
jgi:HEAT repeat protein